MKILFKIFFLIIIVSCGSTTKTKIDTPLIKDHFSAEQRKELATVLFFVDSIVLSNSIHTKIDKAYHSYLDSILILGRKGLLDSAAFDENQKYAFLFSLDTIMFNEIWTKRNTARVIKTKDTVLYNLTDFTSIDINTDREYVKLLSVMSKDNDHYKNLLKSMEIMGGLSPSAVSEFLNSHNDFDFNNINDRIWAAIFLLSLEEAILKKVNRYLE